MLTGFPLAFVVSTRSEANEVPLSAMLLECLSVVFTHHVFG